MCIKKVPVFFRLIVSACFFAVTLYVFSFSSSAQTSASVSGHVLDPQGKPVAGASVSVQDSNQGTTTDSTGYYKLTVRGSNPVLVFSGVSYAKQEVPVNKRTTVNVILKELQSVLDDVIVIGYGSVRRRDLTGSVGSANVEDMQKAPVRSFEEALAGRIAGVQVSSPDGQPGAASTIVIRGNNSITQDNSPLYVIDGFPVENPNNNAINPADIESIDVLKDASATAIYGARGANGVIIITTKQGRPGQAPVVSFDAYAGSNKATKTQKLLDAYEFVRLQTEINPIQATARYLVNHTLEDYKTASSIDWQDHILQTAPFQNYNLAVRGGSGPGSNFSVSLNALNQKGAIINSGFKRYQGRASFDQKVGNKLKIGANINYSYSKSYGVIVSSYGGNDRSNSFLASVWGYRPLAGALSDSLDQENGQLINSGADPDLDNYYYNPLSTAKNTLNDRFTNAFTANAYLQYTIINNLTLRVTGTYNKVDNKTNIFYNSHTRQGDINYGGTGPYGSVTNASVANYVNENTLNYKTAINKVHWIDALVGFTNSGIDNSMFGATGSQVPNESLGVSGLDESDPSSITSLDTYSRLLSFLARLNYNYKSTYYLTASWRADGSSKFAPENHWAYFPSAAISWRMTNQPFMKYVPFISDAKLRLGYGVTGNNRVTDFPYLSTITLPATADYAFGGDYSNGAVLSGLGNQNLKWETTKNTNAGIDLQFLNNKMALTVDYYNKITSDLLLNASLPGSTGFTSAFENIGKVQNKGWEFTVTSTNISAKDFTWSTNFNISFNRNKVKALVDGQESMGTRVPWSKNGYGDAPAYIAKVGQPIALMYGYVFDGLYQYDDFNMTSTGTYVLKPEVPNNGSTRSTIKPGYVKYKDLNGDGVVDSKDQTIIGRPYPIHTGGFSNNFRYKNFDLNVFLQWSYGNQLINANRYLFEGQAGTETNQLASYANRWTPTNTNTDIPAVNGFGGYNYSSRVVEDGSYLRLKTVQIGYAFPEKWLKKAKIKTFRIYASAQNLITWTNYSGLDPEVSAYESALTPGFDFSAYPRSRTITFGLSTSF